MSYGYFDDADRAYVITDPVTPRPWINYLSNRRLSAFISQNAGGLLWYYEPLMRRITRYHYIASPPDRPGFYLYIHDRGTGTLWNPHFAPTNTPLDAYLCSHAPGVTTMTGEKDGVQVQVTYTIPPDDDVMLWKITINNTGSRDIDIQVTSYLEFGLLEFLRETLAWAYLKNHTGFSYDRPRRCIRYDYHVFEAPFTPRMLFGCTAEVAGFDCDRNAFIGRTGTLEHPRALTHGFSHSELPLGGHGCGALGVDVRLQPGDSTTFAYRFAIAETWQAADGLLDKYDTIAAIDAGIAATRTFYETRLSTFQLQTDDAALNRNINTWCPYNSLTTLVQARMISTDHMGLDGLKYRDTTQDALAVAHLDPSFALERMRMVFAQQKADGGGCYAFYPFIPKPTVDEPHRSDNTVWQIYTMNALLAETGDLSLADEVIPFRDSGEASIYEHTLRGLQHIEARRGPHGLPTLFHADWNDGLALFQDERAESVMLGMQLVYSCQEMGRLASALGRDTDVAWCHALAAELTEQLNSEDVWDGRWYRRLLFSNGTTLGSCANRQGKIYLNPQAWSVISAVGNDANRGLTAMDAAAEYLDSPYGMTLLMPPFTGIPEPEDLPLGSSPGTGENGSIFSHANSWAIIAECVLGRADRAYRYYRQIIPEIIMEKAGSDLYAREPYVYASTIVGPVNDRFGEGGISWLTGTASWMYIAATQYLLGIRPKLTGLRIKPCLPASLPLVRVQRRFRGCLYDITIENRGYGTVTLSLDGQLLNGNVLPIIDAPTASVICKC